MDDMAKRHQTLKADEVFQIYPPLWSKEEKDIEKI